MRRIFAAFAAVLLLSCVLAVPAFAESAASEVTMLATVSSDGDCFVSLSINLRLEAKQNGLTFPVPVNAKDISLNNSAVTTKKTASATEVNIGKITNDYVGQASFRIEYTLPDAVKVVKINENTLQEKNVLQLDIPMLCGFEYPVEKLNFTVTMPAGSEALIPTFRSIYQQTSVEASLFYQIKGSQIVGHSNVVLNDHDGVTMTMQVPEEMFPTVSTYVREGNPEIVPMIIFAVLALVYWIIFLRTWPLIRVASSTAPEGITAGELGCRLTLAGGDLTSMVFTWAQLGYLLIHLDGNGRVLLHKRMDMGNERNQFENKIFKALFGNRRVVDATGQSYARLCHKMTSIVPNERNMFKGNPRNVKVFRFIACIPQVFCGICVAMNMSAIPILYVLMGIILGAFGAISAWLIQDIAARTHLRGKVPVLIGFAVILVWILLGFLCGQVLIPLCCCVGEFIMGYFAAYGGRRSELGRHDAGQVLGLRRFLKRIPTDDLKRMLFNDPDYFFNNAPYALALGIINPFARNFGARKLEQCPYLMTRVHGKRTAQEWAHLMADVADMMDARARRMQVEKWLAVQVQTRPTAPKSFTQPPKSQIQDRTRRK